MEKITPIRSRRAVANLIETPANDDIAGCGNCIWWERLPNELTKGFCKGVPPTPVLCFHMMQPNLPMPPVTNIHPITENSYVCALWDDDEGDDTSGYEVPTLESAGKPT